MERSDWYAKLKALHLCRDCKKQDAYTLAGHTRCYECSEKDRIRKVCDRKDPNKAKKCARLRRDTSRNVYQKVDACIVASFSEQRNVYVRYVRKSNVKQAKSRKDYRQDCPESCVGNAIRSPVRMGIWYVRIATIKRLRLHCKTSEGLIGRTTHGENQISN